MRIEKISDNQIRCILTREDLARRHMKLNELAYGSDKARLLFRDMMQQAAYQYGFEAEDIPLMIEAVPLPSDSIALIVTKVENPEELDTRFSNFGPSVSAGQPADTGSEASAFDRLMSAVRSLNSPAEDPVPGLQRSASPETPEEAAGRFRDYILTNRLYRFPTMDSLVRTARLCAGMCPDGRSAGETALYYDAEEDCYYLTLVLPDTDAIGPNHPILTVLSEYGQMLPMPVAFGQFLSEHGKAVLPHDALGLLAKL